MNPLQSSGSSGGPSTRFSRVDLAVCVLCLAVIVANIYLVRLARTSHQAAASFRRMLEVEDGTRLPALKGVDAGGNEISISAASDRPTVFFVFSPDCAFCESNRPMWDNVIRAFGDHARFVFVGLTPFLADHFAASHGIVGKPLLIGIQPASRYSYSLKFTPQTILVDAKGVVRGVWSGALETGDFQALLGKARENVSVP